MDFAWVAKYQVPRAGGGPLGPSSSELKTLKLYLSPKYNYLKKYVLYFYLMKTFIAFLPLISVTYMLH
jgi:hypothetical protein